MRKKKSIFYLSCLANPEDRFFRVMACVACTSSATDNNIKNIYNEEDILTGIAVFDLTLHRLRYYGPESHGTAGALLFWLQVSGMTTSADPEGGQGVRTPPWKITSYMGFL